MSQPAPATDPPTSPAELHRTGLRRQKIARAIRMRHVYSLLVLSFGLLVVFKYIPIYGVLIAFKDFTIHRGIIASPWNDFEHFRWLFRDPFFFRVLFNTFWISVLRIIFSFPHADHPGADAQRGAIDVVQTHRADHFVPPALHFLGDPGRDPDRGAVTAARHRRLYLEPARHGAGQLAGTQGDGFADC